VPAGGEGGGVPRQQPLAAPDDDDRVEVGDQEDVHR
jgi:hypothetical protein